MFEKLFDTVKEKLDDISTSVDDKIKEAQEKISREDVFISFVEFMDEASDSISNLLNDGKTEKTPFASPASIKKAGSEINHLSSGGSSRSSSKSNEFPTTHITSDGRRSSSKILENLTTDILVAGGSRSNVAADGDLHGYDLSDESENEEQDDVGEIPIIKPEFERLSASTAKAYSVEPQESLDVSEDTIPRYGLPSLYHNPTEMCQRRVITNRRITEADLDEDSPLYRHRTQILGNDFLKKIPRRAPKIKQSVS